MVLLLYKNKWCGRQRPCLTPPRAACRLPRTTPGRCARSSSDSAGKIGRRPGIRVLTPGAINRVVDLLRHMLSWAVGREYIDRTPFRRGSETLIKKLHDDSRRRRRITEDEEAALLAQASPHMQAMIIAALDTGMRQGEMLALRFSDLDLERGLIVLRSETPRAAPRLPPPLVDHRPQGARPDARVESRAQVQGPERRVTGRLPPHQPPLARPAPRVRVKTG